MVKDRELSRELAADPMTASREFLQSADRLVVDSELEPRSLITVVPSRYRRCLEA